MNPYTTTMLMRERYALTRQVEDLTRQNEALATAATVATMRPFLEMIARVERRQAEQASRWWGMFEKETTR